MDISEGFGAIEIPQQSLHAAVAEAQSPGRPFKQSLERQTINQAFPLSVCVSVSLTGCCSFSLAPVLYLLIFSNFVVPPASTSGVLSDAAE